jgi:PAS domain S-box-containing protein
MGSDTPPSPEHAVRELAMLKAALDAHAIVAITDTRGVIQYVNGKFCDLSGYAQEELVGNSHAILNSGCHDRGFFRDLWATIASGRTWRGEIRNRAKSGRLYWVDTVIVPILDERGRPHRYVSIRHDITARKDAEQAEREHEQRRYRSLDGRLRTVWDSVPAGLCILDLSGLLLDINPAALALFGVQDRASVIGRGVCGLVHPEDRDAFEALHRQAAQGQSTQGLYRICPATGGERWVKRQAVPLRMGGDDIDAVLNVTMDVTERMQAEASLRIAKDAAEAGERAKAEFLANMSHEIRTPLNAVLGMSDLLMDTTLTAAQHQWVQAIRNSGRALLDLITDVLDLSKMEAGRLELQCIETDLVECAEIALEMVAPAAAAKGLELLVDVSPEVPGRVSCDPARLRQVLLNLLSNAVKFTDAGHVAVRLDAPEAQGGRALRVTVSDTGIGIPPQQVGRLFRRFSQVDATIGRQHGGTGLGLAICRHLVERMGGHIDVHSVPGEGSRFVFELPLVPGRHEAPVPHPGLQGRRIGLIEAPSAPPGLLARRLARLGLVACDPADPRCDAILLDERLHAGFTAPGGAPVILMRAALAGGTLPTGHWRAVLQKPLRTAALVDTLCSLLARAGGAPAPAPAPVVPPPLPARRVLLVEDNEINQMVASSMLARLGCEVTIAPDGQAGVAAIESAQARPDAFDIVFMDVQMPVLDGIEATRRVRASAVCQDRPPWIVAMTANALNGDREACLAAGMNDYLSKPLSVQAVCEALGRAPAPGVRAMSATGGGPEPSPAAAHDRPLTA